MKSENEKPEGGLANLANLANSELEKAKQAPSPHDDAITEHLAERAAIQEYDGALTRHDAEAAARSALRVYRYRLRDVPGSDLILIAPGTSLDEATQGLLARFGKRLIDVTAYEFERHTPATDGVNKGE